MTCANPSRDDPPDPKALFTIFFCILIGMVCESFFRPVTSFLHAAAGTAVKEDADTQYQDLRESVNRDLERNRPIEVGDLVCHRTGTRQMVVVEINDGMAKCRWGDAGSVNDDSFYLIELEQYRKKPEYLDRVPR